MPICVIAWPNALPPFVWTTKSPDLSDGPDFVRIAHADTSVGSNAASEVDKPEYLVANVADKVAESDQKPLPTTSTLSPTERPATSLPTPVMEPTAVVPATPVNLLLNDKLFVQYYSEFNDSDKKNKKRKKKDKSGVNGRWTKEEH